VKNEAEAAGYFKFAADQNHAATQFHSIFCLEGGQSVVKDEAEAVGYFKLSTDQNHTLVQFHYTVCLEDGRGVAKNEANRHVSTMNKSGLTTNILQQAT
jgi:TPR repeat protein